MKSSLGLLIALLEGGNEAVHTSFKTLLDAQATVLKTNSFFQLLREEMSRSCSDMHRCSIALKHCSIARVFSGCKSAVIVLIGVVALVRRDKPFAQ